jgi:hypothetical protein
MNQTGTNPESASSWEDRAVILPFIFLREAPQKAGSHFTGSYNSTGLIKI